MRDGEVKETNGRVVMWWGGHRVNLGGGALEILGDSGRQAMLCPSLK